MRESFGCMEDELSVQLVEMPEPGLLKHTNQVFRNIKDRKFCAACCHLRSRNYSMFLMSPVIFYWNTEEEISAKILRWLATLQNFRIFKSVWYRSLGMQELDLHLIISRLAMVLSAAELFSSFRLAAASVLVPVVVQPRLLLPTDWHWLVTYGREGTPIQLACSISILMTGILCVTSSIFIIKRSSWN